MYPEHQRIATVFGLIIIAAVIVGGVFAYIYLGWFGVLAVGAVIAFVFFEGVVTELPVWLERAMLRRRQRQGRCVHCGYDLRGNPQATVCSECGKPTADAKAT